VKNSPWSRASAVPLASLVLLASPSHPPPDSARCATEHRRIVFERHCATSATHVVSIQVVGTAGHPRVDLDAFLRVS
jgi:hypothetical protein